MDNFVKVFIGFVFVVIVFYFIVVGVLFYKTINIVQLQDFSHGIKPVMEKIWCGEVGCLDRKE
jgi:hypothetical protein